MLTTPIGYCKSFSGVVAEPRQFSIGRLDTC